MAGAFILFIMLTGSLRQPLAFNGAEGAGRFSAGGRGGPIMMVTSLADSGAGSLRTAIDTPGPRIIKFAVAGTIRLQSDLVIRNPRITITGEGAPAGGIAIADRSLIIKADDVVIRYFRSRLGNRSGVDGDAISISGGRRIILDHVSASWSVDETLSVSARYGPTEGIYDVTVQWSIISESLRKSGHVKGDHGYGSLIRGGRGSRFSFRNNLWAHHVQRMPRPGNYAAAADDPLGPIIEFRSNIFYNWGGNAAGYNSDKDSIATYAFVDNCYVTGPDTKSTYIFREENPFANSWFAGNRLNGVIPKQQRDLVKGHWVPLKTAPYIAPAKFRRGNKNCDDVLRIAGASEPRDTVDRRVVADVRNRTGRIIDSQNDVGGWPDLSQ